MGEIARVDLVASGTNNATAESNTIPLGQGFQAMLAEVEKSDADDSKAQVVERWIAQQKQFPVIQDDVAHFIYRGKNSDVALAGDFFGARQEKKMIPIDGTDVFYYGVKLHPEQRINYCFLIDYQPTIDSLNKRTAKSTLYAGEMEFALRLKDKKPLEMSWFGMSQWKRPEYLNPNSEREGQLVGKVVERTIDVPDDAAGKTLKIYLPPSYDALADRKYPVLYMLDGTMAREAGEMIDSCNRLFNSNDELSAIVVFLDGRGPKYHELLENEIVPLVDREFKTKADRSHRLIVGCGFVSGEAVVVAALKNELFGNVSSQSPLVFAAEEKMIYETMSKVELPTKVHIQWGRWDIFNPHENWDVRTEAKRISSKLKEFPKLEIVGGVVNDSTDWSSWKNRYVDIFGLLKQ